MKKTSLYDETKAIGGKMVDYFGWSLPVQYQGIVSEHLAVRNTAGLFDVSHMGEILVQGREALEFLQRVCTRDLSHLRQDRTAYTMLCNEAGGVIDDLLVYCLDENEYLLVVNAANTETDLEWLKAWQGKFLLNTQINDVSFQYAQIALQGPLAAGILQKTFPGTDFADLRPYRSIFLELNQKRILLSRTGYTGEDGFEIYLPPEDAPHTWQNILEAGKNTGLVPAGLGARDSLRLEAGMPLYGHELARDISPLEAGLKAFVSLDKEFFVGRDALAREMEAGIKRSLKSLILQDRAIARQGYNVYSSGQKIGQVTSGGFSPILQKSICIALLNNQEFGNEQPVQVEIRSRLYTAQICPAFYKRQRV